jgi:hypothetical protein
MQIVFGAASKPASFRLARTGSRSGLAPLSWTLEDLGAKRAPGRSQSAVSRRVQG